MRTWLYKWLPIFFGCHCRPERSFFYRRKQFPICARCTGEFAGMIGAIGSCFFFLASIQTSLLLMLPMVADGLIQIFTSYESTNMRRLVTGILFGYGLVMVWLRTTQMTFQFGAQIGVLIFGG